jgi:hypothetical protein
MAVSDQPVRLPIHTSFKTRDGTRTKDPHLINCYLDIDPEDQEIRVRQRFGMGAPVYALGAGNGRGIYNWFSGPGLNSGHTYSVVGTELFKDGVGLAVVGGTTAMYKFTQIPSATPYLILGDGTNAYFTDGTTVTKIVDVNFPATFCPGWAYLDGTLYVMDLNNNIFGSANLDDPVTWSALNKIRTVAEPDWPVYLTRYLSYVLAFKRWTLNLFQAVGNPTGSPLGAVGGGVFPFGCYSAYSVQDVDGTLIWLSYNKKNAVQVAMLDSTMIPQYVSSPDVERILAIQANAAAELTVRSWGAKRGGHTFYGVRVGNITLVYDLTFKVWYQWSDPAGFDAGWNVADMSNLLGTYVLAQGLTDGNVYPVDLDTVYPSDNGSPILCEVQTSLFDGGVDRRKTHKMFRLDGDQVAGSTVTLSYSDDDYTTWSAAKSFDMSKDRPMLSDLGTSYRRAYRLRHQGPQPMRLRAGWIQLDIGVG